MSLTITEKLGSLSQHIRALFATALNWREQTGVKTCLLNFKNEGDMTWYHGCLFFYTR